MKPVKLGLIGFGTVGSAIEDLINRNGDLLASRIGAGLEIVKVAVRDTTKKRETKLDTALFTDDPFDVVNDPAVQIVVEAMGGESLALELTLQAAKNGKHIVTANKHLLAMRGAEVFAAVGENGVELGFEAAVAGAIPIVRTLRSSFSANRIISLYGIVNGTANYILSKMADEGAPYETALSEAQRLGYAEADPTFDVEGIDSAHKAAILASLAFGTPVDFSDVYVEGVTRITAEDIGMAKEFGYVIKLLAIAKYEREMVEIRVHPAMVACSNPIAKVSGAFNAIEIDCSEGGVNMLVGPGAGGGPTASAMLGDIADIATKILAGSAGKTPSSMSQDPIAVRPMVEIKSRHYLRFTVPDSPGVLAQLAGLLGDNGISIASMMQRGRKADMPVSVVLMTHTALTANLDKALDEIGRLGICSAPTVVIRVEGEEE